MSIHLFTLISYVLISTFTPGPSNISSASIAVQNGYKNTLNYQAGLATGVFFMMLFSGLISATFLGIFPAFEPVLRYAGAVYILYLAFGILKASYSFSDQKGRPFRYVHGLTLQVLNPKLIVYAFTLFSGFLIPITGNAALVVLAAAILAAISFGATSVWAIFGTAIKTYLHNHRLKTIVNILLSLSLVYTAIVLTGLL
jgi:cysteine/O-acetylserine efflux protein